MPTLWMIFLALHLRMFRNSCEMFRILPGRYMQNFGSVWKTQAKEPIQATKVSGSFQPLSRSLFTNRPTSSYLESRVVFQPDNPIICMWRKQIYRKQQAGVISRHDDKKNFRVFVWDKKFVSFKIIIALVFKCWNELYLVRLNANIKIQSN